MCLKKLLYRKERPGRKSTVKYVSMNVEVSERSGVLGKVSTVGKESSMKQRTTVSKEGSETYIVLPNTDHVRLEYLAVTL